MEDSNLRLWSLRLWFDRISLISPGVLRKQLGMLMMYVCTHKVGYTSIGSRFESGRIQIRQFAKEKARIRTGLSPTVHDSTATREEQQAQHPPNPVAAVVECD